MMFEHAPSAREDARAALWRFGRAVSDAAEDLAATIRVLPNAPAASDDDAELRNALDDFESAFKRIVDVLHKTLSEARYAQ